MKDRTDSSGMPHEQRPASPEQTPHRKWQSHVEELIAEARERGDFANLKGSGRPLRLDTNVHAGDKALAYSLLSHNGVAPPEVERGKSIDAEQAHAEEMLERLRRIRDRLPLGGGRAFASDRRSYNLLRDRTEARYRAALKSLNSEILSLNIIAPPALHRRMLDVDGKIAAFHEEFPPVPE